LKTQNILVDENWVAKVADFGLSRIKKTEQKGAVGSPLYMAPEVLAEQPYSEKADVYRYINHLRGGFRVNMHSVFTLLTLLLAFSFGIIVWELLTQMIPYEDKDFETVAGLPSSLSAFRGAAMVLTRLSRQMCSAMWSSSRSARPCPTTVRRDSLSSSEHVWSMTPASAPLSKRSSRARCSTRVRPRFCAILSCVV
jgi:serine/threonine protein kinase